MMPRGMFFCGSFVSSDAVEIASNPMYAKNTIAAPWWMVVRGIDVLHADDDEEREHQQLHRDHRVVHTRALPHAEHQQPRDEPDDDERRDVHQDRDTADVRGGVQKRLEGRIGRGEQHLAISVHQPRGQGDTGAREEGDEVAAPGDGDGNVPHGVLEDQVPADDPRDDLAERGVGVRIGAPGLRDHRRQLGVAERREGAHAAEQDERDDERRTGAVAHDRHAVRRHLSRGRRADGREDAGADDRADRQHHQRADAELTAQAAPLALRHQLGDRFAAEERFHPR
jgi:hypothetical protein